MRHPTLRTIRMQPGPMRRRSCLTCSRTATARCARPTCGARSSGVTMRPGPCATIAASAWPCVGSSAQAVTRGLGLRGTARTSATRRPHGGRPRIRRSTRYLYGAGATGRPPPRSDEGPQADTCSSGQSRGPARQAPLSLQARSCPPRTDRRAALAAPPAAGPWRRALVATGARGRRGLAGDSTRRAVAVVVGVGGHGHRLHCDGGGGGGQDGCTKRGPSKRSSRGVQPSRDAATPTA